MKFYITSILCIMLSLNLSAKDKESSDYVELPFNISFVPGIGLGDMVSQAAGKKIINTGLAYNILAGRAAKLRGLEYSGIMGQYTEDVHGAQFSGILSLCGGDLNGVQFSGIFNEVSGYVKGAQFGGIVNIVKQNMLGLQNGGIGNAVKGDYQGGQFGGILNVVGGECHGAQFGGIINEVGGNFQGAQFGGIVNIVKQNALGLQNGGIGNAVEGDYQGIQFGGIMNEVGGECHGAQFGGIVNETRGSFQGAQFGGIVNVCQGTLKGVQCAGIVNIAGKVEKGVQIGLINVAKEHHGIPIGLVTHVEGVPKYFEIWGDEMGFIYTGFRSGNHQIYNLVFSGIRVAEEPYGWTFGVGLGFRKPLPNRMVMDVGVNSMVLFKRLFWNSSSQHVYQYQIRGTMIWNSTRRFSIFAGPTLNMLFASNEEGTDFVPYTLFKLRWCRKEFRLWPGFIIGIRLK